MRAQARRTDPASSHDAAARAEAHGAKTQRQWCLETVLLHPGLTSAEIAERLGASRYMPARRLPELARGGLIRRGHPRKCMVLGVSCVTWWPAVEGQLRLF